MAVQTPSPSPQVSRSSSTSSRGPKTPLTLDLSDLPPLSEPTPASNTLIITNLHDPSIFRQASLVQIRELLNQHAPVHTFAPLKSFRRIIVSFYDIDSALAIRQSLDGSMLFGFRIRVYFGQPTPINAADQHLALPKSDKLFFISPPPSPPHGWEMRNEEPPNKEVHAEDLAAALAKLNSSGQEPPVPSAYGQMLDCPSPSTEAGNPEISPVAIRRRTGSSTIVYHPEDHGGSPDLPAIAVEDINASPDQLSPMDVEKPRLMHTTRPPVELMQH